MTCSLCHRNDAAAPLLFAALAGDCERCRSQAADGRTFRPEPPPRQRVILVACGKAKRAEPCAARDLYTSGRFALARATAEASGSPWFILSALHGLTDPARVLAPYDQTLADRLPYERARWALAVLRDLSTRFPGQALDVVILGSNAYGSPLLAAVSPAWGWTIRTPLGGLTTGATLAKLSAGVEL